jgi:hypothetical protein
MIRTLWVVLSACCVAVVLSEVLGMALLWSQGFLSVSRLREMRELLGPQEKEVVAAEAEVQSTLPSSQEVLRERSLRVLSLASLETEVGLLRTMVDAERASVATQAAEFEKQKNAFKTQLLSLSDETAAAAREQARGVLQAMAPADAIERLMQLKSADEDVLLLREMPEGKIALILKELAPAPEGPESAAGQNPEEQERKKRAKEIFAKIMTGEPKGSIIRNALESLKNVEAEPPQASASSNK